MSSCTKLNPSLTKRAIIICSLIAGVIIIGTVVTVTTRNKSQEINSYQKYEFKVKSIEPRWVKFIDKDKSLVNAFVAGTSTYSGSLYVSRVNRTDTMEIVPGVYSRGQKSCIVIYKYNPHEYKEFEILIAEDSSIFVWRNSAGDDSLPPTGALIAGIAGYKNEYKVATVKYNDGDQSIGTQKMSEKVAQVPWEQFVQEFRDFEDLCLNDYNLV